MAVTVPFTAGDRARLAELGSLLTHLERNDWTTNEQDDALRWAVGRLTRLADGEQVT